MFGAGKNYLTICIYEDAIKVAQASSGGSLQRIARSGFSAGSSVDEAAKTLRALLASFNRKMPVICVIPASAATAKTIEVPSGDPDEIKSIINLQANRHTPYSREEVLISYINLGLSATGNTRLLLVIVHRDIVKGRIAILEKAGLQVDKILFAPETEARFYAKALNLKRDAAVTGIIDFAANSATYIVIFKGALLFVRHIPIGIKTIIQGGDAAERLKDEIKKSVDAFMQEDGGVAPSAYWVTSAVDAVKNVLPVLKAGINVEFKVNALANMIKGPRDVRKKLQGDFQDDSFLEVATPACTANKCEINLMPDEMVMKRQVDRQSKQVSMSGVAAVIIMLLVGAIIMTNMYFKEAFLNKNLREQFAPQRSQVAVLQEQMNKVKLVHSYLAKRMVSLDIIHDLTAMTPHTIYLSNITVDEDNKVTIDGIAESMSLVYSYVKSLDDSSIFKEANLKSTTTKKDNGKDVAAFEIEFQLNGPPSGATKEPA